MPLEITNTLTRKKEPFTPMTPGEVKMYVCGPTVYNFIHIGNARPFVFFDVVRRYLEASGFRVKHVMNFTDVDDKIINRAREESSTSEEIGERYIREFLVDMKALDVRPPEVAPRVTTHMSQIIRFIEGLVANGSAYAAQDGEVFFSVRNFREYGKLSGKNVDDLLVGARVDPNEKKRDPLDFSLWKPRKSADEPAWESPWGPGRPGWHIECSAMATEYLGKTFDIHGGGMDLIHPHHENEIAQSEALTHKPFVRVWMHNNMLTLNMEKMSKSVGNILLAREFIEKYTAEALKFLLLSGHYRSTIDFSERHIRDSQAALHRFYSTVAKVEAIVKAGAQAPNQPQRDEGRLLELGESFGARWREAMDDDFNTAMLLGGVFEYVRALNGYFDRKGFKATDASIGIGQTFLDHRAELAKVLNLLGRDATAYLCELKEAVLRERGIDAGAVEKRIAERTAARARKDFAASDAIRDELFAQGIELRDSPQGTQWDIAFAEKGEA